MTVFLVIIGMSIATMLPRIIPLFIVGRISFPKWMNQWLNAIPYAALGALVFPGILNVDPHHPSAGLIGGLVAAVLAFFRLHILFVIFGAILTVYILGLF